MLECVLTHESLSSVIVTYCGINAFRMGSSNSLLTVKSCACAYVEIPSRNFLPAGGEYTQRDTN
jgi:hypothetical protein